MVLTLFFKCLDSIEYYIDTKQNVKVKVYSDVHSQPTRAIILTASFPQMNTRERKCYGWGVLHFHALFCTFVFL